MSLYDICYAQVTLQKVQKNVNSNYFVLNGIFLLCTGSELDFLLLHVLDWTNIL